MTCDFKRCSQAGSTWGQPAPPYQQVRQRRLQVHPHAHHLEIHRCPWTQKQGLTDVMFFQLNFKP